ncbi:ABC transporter ATP-binding protein [Clostridium sp. C105KSO13]|uniref:ABC transporter ATP-binding protein n=1 Tax=Clostridium sp. C105KSO13 TaxID=1776045 RepID=UPI0007406259|nr:ABC transporter ATP-binding protein [Clostridium sp. C105KSO13]CUX30927.1 ABC transporter ATP-binding protein YxdL [Clostridium sp. C105KSO13]
MRETEVLEVNELIRNYEKQSSNGERDDIKVLKGISFQVENGDFLGIMGKSGCGKTTLLKVLGLIDRQTDGTLKFMGKDTEGLHSDELADIRRKQIGFVFQDFYLMDSLSVKENIMLPLILDKEKSETMAERTKRMAEQFQIDTLLEKDPYELSGGEKQRVAICRALINNPDLILADEPTGNLDTKSGKIVIDALLRINQEYEKTVVMVTHDPKMASRCEKIILLKDGVILETLKKNETDESFYQRILEKMEVL